MTWLLASAFVETGRFGAHQLPFICSIRSHTLSNCLHLNPTLPLPLSIDLSKVRDIDYSAAAGGGPVRITSSTGEVLLRVVLECSVMLE
jgi:hypothetical protein